MTYTAQLFIGDCLYKTIAIEHPREQIIYHSPKRLSMPIMDNPMLPMVMGTDTMVFRIDKQIGQFLLRYVFDYATGRVDNYGDYVEVFDERFDEASENVNLDKLKDKLRSKENMTKLLLRFFRAE